MGWVLSSIAQNSRRSLYLLSGIDFAPYVPPTPEENPLFISAILQSDGVLFPSTVLGVDT